MVLAIWCLLWTYLQDFAFWLDDLTNTAVCGNVTTWLMERLTPEDF